VQENGTGSEQVIELYRQTMLELVNMQVQGFKGFDASWCWDSSHYDRQVMLERESGYFLQALCRDLLQMNFSEQEIGIECQSLAERAGQAKSNYFLHRDFQSRNIMLQQGRVRFIDYQAGRLGPLGYDLASLLIDPYVSLPQELQDELLKYYLDALTAFIPYDRQQFQQEYLLLALQRNFQILGAFAFLSKQRGKVFFQQYIQPALYSLQGLLARTEYPCLKALVDRCCRGCPP
ncbi:MAG: DUF1679 domain-containing protein, partial [Candidatus Electrothrix sp. AR3]|nr:DUF1679 domain-containing protein [Candidatus Electrothrix sp. AR3]